MKREYSEFIETVWEYFHTHSRRMPWREDTRPYAILVSELMLQQTQVERVIPKFELFMQHFPDVQSLAQAPLADVLSLWNGLGYNRRAKFLHQSARYIAENWNGKIPEDRTELIKLPGVGENTAGAILAYAFNEPVVFIETNIRAVYLHHFFSDETDVPDSSLAPLIEATLDTENPREWYWALMDYGTHIKRTHGNSARRSKHHVVQSKFEGSNRQIRGAILSRLTDGKITEKTLLESINDDRTQKIIDQLVDEGLISRNNKTLKLG